MSFFLILDYLPSIFICAILTIYTFHAGIKTRQTENASPVRDILSDTLTQYDRASVLSLLKDLNINPENYTLKGCIDLLSNKKQDLINQKNCKIAFLMGDNQELGKNSKIHKYFFKSDIYEQKLCDEIFQFAGLSEKKNHKEKNLCLERKRK